MAEPLMIDPLNEAQQRAICIPFLQTEHPMLDPEKHWRDLLPAAIRALTALRELK